MSEKEIIIVEESLIKSGIKDGITFGMFAGLMYFNHRYLGGRLLIDVLFIGCVILFLVGRASKNVHKFDNKKEAIDYLATQKSEDK